MKFGPWTKQELDILRQSKGKSFGEITRALPSRTPPAIRQKLMVLDIPYKKHKGRPLWTQEEIEALLANHKTKTTLDIATMLGKSRSAVARQCEKLGIQIILRAGGGNNHGKVLRFWTKEEKRKILWNAGTMSIAALAKMLKRSRYSVSCMAHQLGVDTRQGTYSVGAVAKILGTSDLTVRRYRDSLGRTWGTYDHKEHSRRPGAKMEDVQEIAQAILSDPTTLVPVPTKHLQRIASGEWDLDPLLEKDRTYEEVSRIGSGYGRGADA